MHDGECSLSNGPPIARSLQQGPVRGQQYAFGSRLCDGSIAPRAVIELGPDHGEAAPGCTMLSPSARRRPDK